jgi:hypothetical protein
MMGGGAVTTGVGEKEKQQTFFSALKKGAAAVADFVGLDGKFGYGGPNGRTLSLAGWGQALRSWSPTYGATPAETSTRSAAISGSVATVLSQEAIDFLTDPGDLDSGGGALKALLSGSGEGLNFTLPAIGNPIRNGLFVKAEFEPYEPTGVFDQLNWFERILVGVEAHEILTRTARGQQDEGWWANVSKPPRTSDGELITFGRGRPDIGLSSRGLNLVWELKPDTPGAIERGQEQLFSYVQGQRSQEDRFGVRHWLTNGFRIADKPPWRFGLELEPNVGYPGNTFFTQQFSFWYRDAGYGIIAYSVSRRPEMQPFSIPAPQRGPELPPLPLPRRIPIPIPR